MKPTRKYQKTGPQNATGPRRNTKNCPKTKK
jgi:hypothetical protein